MAEITAVESALIAATDYDEVVVLGLNYEDGAIQIHTSMDYQPDVFYALSLASKLMLQTGGPLDD
jgi:hypothetical protein